MIDDMAMAARAAAGQFLSRRMGAPSSFMRVDSADGVSASAALYYGAASQASVPTQDYVPPGSTIATIPVDGNVNMPMSTGYGAYAT